LRQRRVIDVLDEHGVGFARREHAHRFGGYRPAGEPLYRGAEAVGAAEHRMVEARLLEQILHRLASPRHFGIGKARILRLVDRAQALRQREAVGTAAFAWMNIHIGNFNVRGFALSTRTTHLTGTYLSCHARADDDI
jgi:hypothetical protein